jgi:hypothetical protein
MTDDEYKRLGDIATDFARAFASHAETPQGQRDHLTALMIACTVLLRDLAVANGPMPGPFFHEPRS